MAEGAVGRPAPRIADGLGIINPLMPERHRICPEFDPGRKEDPIPASDHKADPSIKDEPALLLMILDSDN